MSDSRKQQCETRTFISRQQLNEALSEDVALQLAAAITQRGHALLVVSGGATPVSFFRLLSAQDLPWQQVTITLADERWVDPSDEASNEKLVRENLLINKASAARFVPLKNSAKDPASGVVALEPVLAELDMIDVLVLGMGTDGHTASLFPGADELDSALQMDSGKSCMAVNPPEAPYPRMTLTLPRLLNSRQIILHITGAQKLAVYEEAINTSDRSALPVSYFLQQIEVPVSVYWAT